jgi:hypothetical protein
MIHHKPILCLRAALHLLDAKVGGFIHGPAALPRGRVGEGVKAGSEDLLKYPETHIIYYLLLVYFYIRFSRLSCGATA